MLIELSSHLAELVHNKLLTFIHNQERAHPKVKEIMSTTIHKLELPAGAWFQF
jgi:hypothetical protein